MEQEFYIVTQALVAKWKRFTNGVTTIEFREDNSKQWVINCDSGIEEIMNCSTFRKVKLGPDDFPPPIL